jgi:hypothetical protein
MLGTTPDTVVCPNALVLSGTNILTRISDSISTAFTNFSGGSYQWTGANAFATIFAGSNFAGKYVKIDNGVLTTQGLTTPANAKNTGVIQTIGYLMVLRCLQIYTFK